MRLEFDILTFARHSNVYAFSVFAVRVKNTIFSSVYRYNNNNNNNNNYKRCDEGGVGK